MCGHISNDEVNEELRRVAYVKALACKQNLMTAMCKHYPNKSSKKIATNYIF